MNISKFCIKHKVSTLLAVIMIAIFGLTFLSQLQMALMPNMEFPMAVVVSYYSGASPSDMEELVTRPLETAIMSVSGVDEITSTSSDSMTQVQITYVDGTDVDIAANKQREQFDLLSLPDGASKPIIMNLNVSDMMPTAIVALAGDDLADLQALAEDTIAPTLERIDGVASVSVNGGVENQVSVRIDPTRAAGFGLSNAYISQFLAAENLLYPGGDLQNGSKTLTVSTDAKFQTVDDIANMLIALPTGGTIRLNEVADVAIESVDGDAIAKVDGTACVILQVSKQSGANEAAASDAVAEAMAELQAKNESIVYSMPYLASEMINMSVDAAFSNIFLGMLLAAVVVYLFLRRAGATMTIIVSMPVCILSVFILMNVMDLTLNMMSLGGIALGVGMIVDNSIVVLENIYRFSSDGYSRMEACVEGTREVTTSVVASTLTTLAVFVPLGLTTGIAGMMFKDFCLTIASLIGASLIIALTLVPLLCYFLLDEDKVRAKKLRRGEKPQNGLVRLFSGFAAKLNGLYLRLLKFFVYHLKAGLLVTVVLVVVFVASLASTNMVLMPEMDEGQISVSVSLPIGSDDTEAAAIADRISAIIQNEVPELDDMYYIAQSESVTLMANLVDKGERERSSMEVADDLRGKLTDIAGCEITTSASSSSSMMGDSNDISVQITGEDYDTLTMIADDLKQQIAALPDAIDVESSVSEKVPQVQVTMNREAAAQYGLTAATVGAAVRAELTGSTATTVTIDNKELDVVVKGDGIASESLDALRSMPVASALGGYVPLSSVADVSIVQAAQSITRDNQSRQVSVTGDTISGNTTAMTAQILQLLDNYSLPDGYTASSGGSYADMMDSFTDLGLALLVALGLVYFVLAAQFESFLMPVIVMMILPVAFSGALFALPLTGRDISMISLVAIIMLAGTVVNSSIILVEYIKIRRGMGEDRQTAILNACPLRVRPVLM